MGKDGGKGRMAKDVPIVKDSGRDEKDAAKAKRAIKERRVFGGGKHSICTPMLIAK